MQEICNLPRFACFVNSSLRFLITNLHPICTCSCLFTPLTEGRSPEDLTQAATSQKNRLCRTARQPFSSELRSTWLLKLINSGTNVCGCMHIGGRSIPRVGGIPHWWLARLTDSCQSKPSHSVHCPAQDIVQRSQRCR